MQEIEAVSVPGCSLWTARQGHGPALVCCHGGPGLWDYLAPVAEMLDDLVTVYRYDQRACGRSTGGPPYDVATVVADLDALRDHWGLSQWIVLGHSWGATLALAYCLTHPSRVRALMYLCGTGIDASWKEEYHKNQDALLTPSEQHHIADLRAQLSLVQGAEFDMVERAFCELSWSTDIADRSRAGELARQLFVDGLHINFQVNRVLGKDGDRFTEQSTIVKQVASVQLPALIVHGALDPRPARVARDLAQCMPFASYVELPHVGYLPWIEQPDLLRDVLRAFLFLLD
ncbi:MAG: alpha/beta hydrolase [Chloroflexota bacterium]|nr:alpha/beta hydrolase [Chloroflexota bacterium]